MTAWQGHDEAEAAIRAALSGGKMHHGWILCGPRGIGKASFASRAAALLLSGPGAGGDATALVGAGTHPDYRLVTREARETKGDEGEGELKRNISIAQIRALGPFLHARPALSQRKVVVIDSIDELERAGANALLKGLEEPGADTVFLLVSHAPERLLPTIRSRCRMLRFAPLDIARMRSAIADRLPDASPAEIDALAVAGNGAPGQALEYAGLELAEIERMIAALLRDGDPGGALAAALSAKLSPKAQTARYEAFLRRAPSALAEAARRGPVPALPAALAAWEEAVGLAARAGPLNLDKATVVIRMAGLLARDHAPRNAA